MRFDTLVAPLRADVSSGASAVGRAAADVVRNAVGLMEVDSVDRLGHALVELAAEILNAQPSMAPLVTLAARVLGAVEEAETVEDGKRAAVRAAEAFRSDVESWSEGAVREASRVLGEVRSVLTLSASSTVTGALEARAAGGDLRVVCLESRPGNEGRRTALRLAEAGAAVVFGVDAAVGSLLSGCDAVVLGADSVGDRGVANKIGSRAAAMLARQRGVPVYVLTDGTKLLPPGFPQPTDDERPPDEVWDVSGEIRIWNRYFETFPVEWTAAVITEAGALGAEQVHRVRARLPLPEALRRWAREREEANDSPLK